MNDLKTRLGFACVVLHELSREPLSRSVLEKRSRSRVELSFACFEGIFRFLVADGDIEKSGPAHRAPFRITEKGRAFLVWRATGE